MWNDPLLTCAVFRGASPFMKDAVSHGGVSDEVSAFVLFQHFVLTGRHGDALRYYRRRQHAEKKVLCLIRPQDFTYCKV